MTTRAASANHQPAMLPLNELRGFARAACQMLAGESDLAEYEVYCSSSEQFVARLNYTSDIPCRGVEELKSQAAAGFSIRIVSRDDRHRIGTAFEAGDLSLEALRVVLERARRAIVCDPHFPGLPAGGAPPDSSRPAASDLLRAREGLLAAAAWSIVGDAIAAFERGAPVQRPAPGLIVGGDVTITRDRIAVAGSNFARVRADQSARFSSNITVLIESMDAKGTASAVGREAAELRRAAGSIGSEAVRAALRLGNGERPGAGVFSVVLGAQPVGEILNYMVVPSLTTGAFYAASSAYQERFGQQVMDARLDLTDDPRALRGPIQRTITCEGMPAHRTGLIRAGRLLALMSNYYDAHRLASDPNRRDKLGFADAVKFAPRNGYRMAEGGERRFDSGPGTSATNIVMKARGGLSDRELLEAAGDGIYAGRVWYTYPINGQRAGDFTCTISGDSWLVRGGKLAAPLAPNALRINSHIDRVFNHLIAAGRKTRPAMVWGAAAGFEVPALVVEGIELDSIGIGG